MGPESEAERVRSHGRRVTKWARKSNTDISGIGGAARRVPRLRQGEAGAARLSGGQSALHHREIRMPDKLRVVEQLAEAAARASEGA